MQIEQLRIELRPRTNAQALDLGFALLRAHAGAAYMGFLALWLPIAALMLGLTLWLPAYDWAWMLAGWWVKPALERAPLYVLSRQVFGEPVTWQQALRAWPGQLGGGLWLMLTVARPFAAGRGLYQPVWQLELARGAVARARKKVLGRDGTGQSALWFGVVCAHLEVVLQVGLLGLIGIFISDPGLANPLAVYMAAASGEKPLFDLLVVAVFALAVAVMAPVYTACCFTLYLNRRASLEAWDIELQLRQIRPPALKAGARRSGQHGRGPVVLACALLLALAAPAPETLAAPPPRCAPPPALDQVKRGPHHNAAQAALRRQVDQVFAGDDLRPYECVKLWKYKGKLDKEQDRKRKNLPSLALLADVMKVILIALLLGAVAWLLLRYRHAFPAMGGGAARLAATEVGGLDIRAASLPEDITGAVRALWKGGEQRAALGLLYRATLSRLMTENGLALRQGDTEGDCLRLAGAAQRAGALVPARFEVAAAATALWLAGAWGNRWPDSATVHARCAEWDAQFAPLRRQAGDAP